MHLDRCSFLCISVMTITYSNESYEAERSQTSLAVAGIQLGQKRGQPQSDGLAQTAAVRSTASGELGLLSPKHGGKP